MNVQEYFANHRRSSTFQSARFRKVYANSELELKALYPNVFCVRCLDSGEYSGIVDMGGAA